MRQLDLTINGYFPLSYTTSLFLAVDAVNDISAYHNGTQLNQMRK